MSRPRLSAPALLIAVLPLAAAASGAARAGGPAPSAAAQSPAVAWTEAAPAPERWWAAATFLPQTCEMLAYGGDYFNASGSSVLPRDTLIYQPADDRWLSIAPQKSGGPPPLTHAGLTFDPDYGIAVLFGGGGSGLRNDTYAFSASTRKWTTLIGSQTCTATTCPSPRMMHAQAWSSALSSVLVFGGAVGRQDSAVTNDVWALGAFAARRGGVTWKWTRLQPSADPSYGMPAPRSRHGMAEIPGGPHAGSLLIYGGFDANGNTLSDTWLYDAANNSFTFLANAGSPTQRQGFAMGFAPPLGAIIVQGGQLNSMSGREVYTQETWVFDHDALEWAPVSVNSPYGNRSYHDVVADTCRGTVVMFDKPATSKGLYSAWLLR
jgi:hypothetical protein